MFVLLHDKPYVNQTLLNKRDSNLLVLTVFDLRLATPIS